MARRNDPSTPLSAAEQATADAETAALAASTGKGRPTPTRKEREAARKRPLVPNDRKRAREENRQRMAEARERAREGLARGDERYLPQRDRGPQRRYVRDYVDARTSFGEFMIPVMFLVIIATFLPSLDAQFIAIIALWAFFLIAVADSILLANLVKRRLKKKFGDDRVEKGVGWYAGMRALQLRVLRLPKPQVKRGEYPV
ncbi:DUF3043 family protein [Microcella putealis]|uniref:DUF3043 family protein n=1 Tax=Microcella putealis TaxID=337005 RepID=A0A4Q7LIH1_9MICO|nr:DUF3043 domain-containing protein [Microcella putealis]RZS54316.1 DUF3043 family protein [Microcella putealis]TQM24930.1 DUF3043 family protein [Microcella putealis]